MTAILADLGPHWEFILACYAITIIVLGGLFVWLVGDRARLTREIAALEADGVTRRSARASVRPDEAAR